MLGTNDLHGAMNMLSCWIGSLLHFINVFVFVECSTENKTKRIENVQYILHGTYAAMAFADRVTIIIHTIEGRLHHRSLG
jgi:hypothetical protein